jgi:CubicO group peptidase (beta-lactamase class C family)
LVLTCTSCAHNQHIRGKLDSYITSFAEQDKFSGSVLVANDKEVLLSKGYGMANYELDIPATSQTKFRVASITKQFTAMAIMQLQEQGLLSVEDKLSKYILDYPNADKITIHHLLTHRSGIPNPCRSSNFKEEKIKPHTLEQIIELFKNEPLDFQPGEQFKYSNSGYVLLSYIIEKTSGKKYDLFLKESIFDVIDMNDSGYDTAYTIIKNRASGYRFRGNELINADYVDMTFVSGAGGLYSTVEDLHKWDRALYTEKLVSKNSLMSIFTPYYATETGYGWWIYKFYGRNVVSHNGGIDGFSSVIHRYPDDKICIIILGNREEIDRYRIAKGLAAIIFGEEYQLPVKRFAITVDPSIYDKYVGKYKFDDDVIMNIVKAKDRLFAEVDGHSNIELLPETENRFFQKMTEVQVSFLKDEYGKITGLVLRDQQDNLT